MNERTDDISSLLNEAFNAYEGLENKKYAPIFNSHIMLKKIKKHHEERFKEISKRRRDKLNVGLLAAKALDFDANFIDYSMILHNVWNSFLSFLGTPYKTPVSGPQKDAYLFYRGQKYTKNQAYNHMQGIDFSKAVDAKFNLSKGSNVAQWKNKKIDQGNYYSETCEKPDCLGVYHKKPDCLGIYHKQEDYQGNIDDREEHIYSPMKDIICLQSHAAAILDTWSIKGQSYKTKGGCIQYFNSIDRKHFKHIPASP